MRNLFQNVMSVSHESKEQLEFLRLQGICPSHASAFLSLGLLYGIPNGVLSFESVKKWIMFADKYGAGDGVKMLELLRECVSNESERKEIIQFIIKFYSDRFIYR
jgi:hypothetical protein